MSEQSQNRSRREGRTRPEGTPKRFITHLASVRDFRRAVAPYNFVPLPNPPIVLPAPGAPEEGHDSYDPSRCTGTLSLHIETLTPLYIRGTVPLAADGKPAGEAKDQVQFFAPSRVPSIPGSSLRGMIRSLIEILSWSRIDGVSDRHLFTRDFVHANSSYLAAMQERDTGAPTSMPGYLKRIGGKIIFQPALTLQGAPYLRIEQDRARAKFPDLQSMFNQITDRNGQPALRPNGAYRWMQKDVWFKLDKPDARHYYRDIKEISPTDPGGAGAESEWQHGCLVASGWVGGSRGYKQRHWIIPDPDPDPKAQVVDVSAGDEDLYLEGGGVTPAIREMAASGFSILRRELPANELVPCFLIEQDGHTFFGHTPMFRYPYRYSVHDAFPGALRDASVTGLSDAIFGRAGERDRSFAGRVAFEDAPLGGQRDGASENASYARILSTPKPTTFQHYLAQRDDGGGQGGRLNLDTLVDWDSPDATARGHKVFWHRPGDDPHHVPWQETQPLGDRDTQHTRIAPIRAERSFSARIHFENLTNEELGALLFALMLPEGCAHRLGMGKPLGLGSVRLHVEELELHDRVARYRSIFDISPDPLRGEALATAAAGFTDAFARWVLTQLAEANDQQAAQLLSRLQAVSAANQGEATAALWEHPRLKELRTLLAFEKAPPTRDTRYMSLDDFRNGRRAVLPRATQVAGMVTDESDGRGSSGGRSGNTTADIADTRRVVAPKPGLRRGGSHDGAVTESFAKRLTVHLME